MGAEQTPSRPGTRRIRLRSRRRSNDTSVGEEPYPCTLSLSHVATSRLHENRHYASDVVFGATIGIIAGRTVTRHGKSYYAADVQFVPGGIALAFVRHPPT